MFSNGEYGENLANRKAAWDLARLLPEETRQQVFGVERFFFLYVSANRRVRSDYLHGLMFGID